MEFKSNLKKALLNCKTSVQLENLLEGLLTEKEFKELNLRLEIVKLLNKKIPHHQIAQQLGVGVSTVTRGSKELQKGNFKYLPTNWA